MAATKSFVRLALLAPLLASCAGAVPGFPPRPPLLRDPDRRPFAAQLEPYYSPTEWDRFDQSFFRPVVRFFAVQPGGEAANVNTIDEVPDSSWFEDRLERLDPGAMALGPCPTPGLDAPPPWKVVAGKPDGAYPGFVMEDARGQRYLIKVEGGLQGFHNSVADVVGSRIYFAAGFDVPCNQVADFSRSMLTLAPTAKVTLRNGEQRPMRWSDVDWILLRGRKSDGRWRGLASRYLDGRPLGPWTYQGTRADDRNDIVPHEDRRELRGSRLLAAWTDHWDARAQNTLSMWIETRPGHGFVRHHLLDFGDCFGGFAGDTAVQLRRRGQVHWFDPGQVLTDFATLGLIERPWDRAKLGPSGTLFGFYDIERFDPERWSPSYPNPAFARMTEHDAAWMARIIARFGQPELEAIVSSAKLDRSSARELVRLLLGRRRKVLERYLTRLSPLARPRVNEDEGGAWLCADDLAVASGLLPSSRYAARAWHVDSARPLADLPLRLQGKGRLCVGLPTLPASGRERRSYFIVQVVSEVGAEAPQVARFHLYQLQPGWYLLAGLERLPSAEAGN